MNDSLVGKSINRYHILERLGEGGMAKVYKVFDTRLEREVAIKLLRTERLDSKKAIQRFEIEAKALAKLNHPNIVQVLDYGEHEGTPYLVMEYVPGGTLKEQLGKPMLWQQAAKLLAPIARALAYAHEHNLIHRDVKPSNILITSTGIPKLADFGIAKMLEMEETMDLTGTSVGVGTPWYMSPEQGRGQQIDHRTDVYSLGIVFYELVTGRKPYQADTPMAVIYQHVQDPLPRPTKIVSSLPGHVEQFLFKALTKEPENRFQSMGEMAGALKQMGAGTKARIRVKGRTSKRIRAMLVGIAVVATLVAAGMVLLPRLQNFWLFRSAEITSPMASLESTATVDLAAADTAIVKVTQAAQQGTASASKNKIEEAIANDLATSIASRATQSAKQTQLIDDYSSFTQTPKPEQYNTPTSTPVEILVFEEDFENGEAHLFDLYEGEDRKGNWEVLFDETGNAVLEINNSEGDSHPSAKLGSENWDNYKIKFRMRFMDINGFSGAGCSFRVTSNQHYSFIIEPIYHSTTIGYWNRTSDWESLRNNDFNVEKDKWYSLRIEILNERIKAYVNGHLVDIVSDSRISKGNINLKAHPHTHVQFDDVRVYLLEN